MMVVLVGRCNVVVVVILVCYEFMFVVFFLNDPATTEIYTE